MMSSYLAGLSGLEKMYLACAVFGGGIFILRTILMLTGIGDTDSDVDSADFDHGGDQIGSLDHGDQGHGNAGLELLTIQGITAFSMMFGLTGFALSRSSLLGAIMTILVGGIVGLFAMWMVARGFALMKSMQSSGTMQIYDAIGEEGTVYLTIPAEGVGKIQITISGRLMVMDAVSLDKVLLKTGERVCVSEITTGGMLAVREI